ncbi:SPOR domain-containing protein [Sutterella sp.]|uniref:SPOR domain-containing protein n=1 Tax=Sutterella sp. TaxID=1981025 RepID=UPI0026DEF503|nr:SPOR domain-containing protein [Sutterella sp.]MDO5530500.1 SPOR domain-containing protein [Sutterella sp.]
MARSGFAAGFAGFLIGVVTGLGIAAGAMLVISKSPVPFMDKVERVTADVDPAAKLAGGVDPNAKLNSPQGGGAAPAAEEGSVRTVTVSASEKPAAPAAQPKAAAPAAAYWVQVGAYSKEPDAETAAAELAMQGIGATVTQNGNNWRVRVGPFENRHAAQEMVTSLTNNQGLNPTIVQ